MKKFATTILLIPFALAGGGFYGLIAHKLFKEREPWFTLCMLCGLAVSVCTLTWLTGASRTAAVWVFIGTGLLYIALRLLFGPGSGLEMFFLAHLCAILLLFLLPALARAQEKAKRLHEMRSPALPSTAASAKRCSLTVVHTVGAGPAWLRSGC